MDILTIFLLRTLIFGKKGNILVLLEAPAMNCDRTEFVRAKIIVLVNSVIILNNNTNVQFNTEDSIIICFIY